MRKFLLLTLPLLLSGCASAAIATKTVDGKVVDCQGSYSALFMDADKLSIAACGGKGSTTGSKVNAELAEMLLKLLIAAP